MTDRNERPRTSTATAPHRRPIEAVPTDVVAFVGRVHAGLTDSPHLVHGAGEFERIHGAASMHAPLGQAVRLFFLNGGRHALICGIDTPGASLTAAHIVDPALQPLHRGLWMLDACEDVNVICIPPLEWGIDVDRVVWDAAIAYAFGRRAMVLIDPPAHWATAADVTPLAIDALVTPHDACANAVLYFPRLLIEDHSAPGQLAPAVPCGAIAGVYVRTDARRGVWKAPAGLEANLEGVAALAHGLTDGQQGRLAALGVNGLRTFPAGHVIWGTRTLRGADALASEWKYIPVRRLALLIEASIERGTSWARAEPSGPLLWEALRDDVGTFLHALFAGGAFQGQAPDEAYFVRCDASTTTQDDIDRALANVMVGFAPLRPAEFVVLRIAVATAA